MSDHGCCIFSLIINCISGEASEGLRGAQYFFFSKFHLIVSKKKKKIKLRFYSGQNKFYVQHFSSSCKV
ncbi:hypothetical protein BpHYR1_006339 [Brachionus plicatilis]|uniref:Uncharacterized protein n=1 Tax=Brachionus plicatilis TaxID=10195 RepID=A0A3M7RHZ9_BRAPC|nr:hypothetical protein BpHYR1_006339 [Brachionus plicatilis]